mgnify:FL=1
MQSLLETLQTDIKNLREGNMARQGLYANINARKKKGISRRKTKSTISPKAYASMKKGFKKKA